ncbi:MAG: phage tail sheath C-terminal domain-containing protein [Marmoricola sp.]
MDDRRKATEAGSAATAGRGSGWLAPDHFIEELPHRPVPIRVDDQQWKFVNVRRLPAFVEHSIVHGLQWVVFEPNDERLWGRVREQVGDFLTTLWRDGRFVGTRPDDAFFVRCDRTTMTQDDLDNGRLIVLVGIAPLRPAEFVIFRIGLWTAVPDE